MLIIITIIIYNEASTRRLVLGMAYYEANVVFSIFLYYLVQHMSLLLVEHYKMAHYYYKGM